MCSTATIPICSFCMRSSPFGCPVTLQSTTGCIIISTIIINKFKKSSVRIISFNIKKIIQYFVVCGAIIPYLLIVCFHSGIVPNICMSCHINKSNIGVCLFKFIHFVKINLNSPGCIILHPATP